MLRGCRVTREGCEHLEVGLLSWSVLNCIYGNMPKKAGELEASAPLCLSSCHGDLSSLAISLQPDLSFHSPVRDYLLLFSTTTWDEGKLLTPTLVICRHLKPVGETSPRHPACKTQLIFVKSIALLQFVSGMFPKGLCDKGLAPSPWKHWGPCGRSKVTGRVCCL